MSVPFGLGGDSKLNPEILKSTHPEVLTPLSEKTDMIGRQFPQ